MPPHLSIVGGLFPLLARWVSCRSGSKQGKETLRLKALANEATYQLTNLDTTQTQTLSGSRLTGVGLEVELARQPDSALIRYRRVGR